MEFEEAARDVWNQETLHEHEGSCGQTEEDVGEGEEVTDEDDNDADGEECDGSRIEKILDSRPYFVSKMKKAMTKYRRI